MRSGHSRVLLAAAVLLACVVLFTPIPAHAVVTGSGSAQVTAGGSTGVTMTTDGATVGVGGGHSGISASPSSGAGPSVRFTFTVGSTVAAGSYGYTFFDDVGGSQPFSLIVSAAPPTPTTIAPPTTTPTTQAPVPTTTRPAVTTTIAEVPETTTTVAETTTTVAPTTTTTTTEPPTTTTTTIPPTTTTSTLVPAGLAAPADGGGDTQVPIALFGAGGAAILAAAAIGIFFLLRRRGPAYGASTPAMVLAWRRFGESRRTSTKRRSKKTRSVGRWWNTAGPVIAYRERASRRQATKTVRRQIEERNRLRKGR